MDKFFTYDGIKLHYTDNGQGHVLLLLHGWGCNTETFSAVRPFLEERMRVIAVDFAGFGQSEEPHAVWGVEEYTRSIEALAEHEGVENPVLVGHSFGAGCRLCMPRATNVARLFWSMRRELSPNAHLASIARCIASS